MLSGGAGRAGAGAPGVVGLYPVLQPGPGGVLGFLFGSEDSLPGELAVGRVHDDALGAVGPVGPGDGGGDVRWYRCSGHALRF